MQIYPNMKHLFASHAKFVVRIIKMVCVQKLVGFQYSSAPISTLQLKKL